MWSLVVVDGDEFVDLGLQDRSAVGAGLFAEPLFEGLLEAFNFAASRWMIRSCVFLGDAQVGEDALEMVWS